MIFQYNPVTMAIPPSTTKKAFGKVVMRFVCVVFLLFNHTVVFKFSFFALK